MANQWLRLWHDMPNDPKWRTIAKAADSSISEVMAIYVHLLVTASLAEERGKAGFEADDVASALDMPIDKVQQIIKSMQGKVLKDNKLMGWTKRQPIKEDGSAERAKAWRQSKKVQTQANEDKRPDKDKETDKETDKERELLTHAQDLSENDTPFVMCEGWQPNEHITELMLKLGIDQAKAEIPASVLTEFVCFWLTKSDVKKSQQQWQHALVRSYLYTLQREKFYAKSNKSFSDVRDTAFDTQW